MSEHKRWRACGGVCGRTVDWENEHCGGAACIEAVRNAKRREPLPPDPIRELLAFLIAKELHRVCRCGAPAVVESSASCRPPVCDACAAKLPEYDDWQDLPHAAATRRLLKP